MWWCTWSYCKGVHSHVLSRGHPQVFLRSHSVLETMSLTGTGVHQLGWLASMFQGSSYICFPSAKIISIPVFMWVLETEPTPSRLLIKHLYPLSHLPSPQEGFHYHFLQFLKGITTCESCKWRHSKSKTEKCQWLYCNSRCKLGPPRTNRDL